MQKFYYCVPGAYGRLGLFCFPYVPSVFYLNMLEIVTGYTVLSLIVGWEGSRIKETRKKIIKIS